MKNIISSIFAILWFFGVLLGTMFFGIFALIAIFFINIVGMLKSGFPTQTVGFIFCFLAALVFSITGWVPALRKCYYKLPWLYPLCMMMTMHLFILSIAEVILAKGFSVINTPRHIAAVVIMIIQLIICRISMCIYFKKNPMVLHKYEMD